MMTEFMMTRTMILFRCYQIRQAHPPELEDYTQHVPSADAAAPMLTGGYSAVPRFDSQARYMQAILVFSDQSVTTLCNLTKP